MGATLCADTRAWLRGVLGGLQPALPDPAIQQHLSGCEHCRGALVVFFAATLGVAAPAAALACADCLDELPAFAEREALRGAAAAGQSAPDVWWHLLTCPDCAAIYELTCAALAAERRGELLSPPLAPAAPPRVELPKVARLVTLARPFLNVALAPARALGATRGEQAPAFVLVEEQTATGEQISVSVRDQADQSWAISVSVAPPPRGRLAITLGETVFRARFDVAGSATVADVPARLFAATDGPSLIAYIESEAATPPANAAPAAQPQ